MIFWTARIRIQGCVGPLLQDLCIRIRICISIIWDHLQSGSCGITCASKISVSRSCKISVSGSCLTTCVSILFRLLEDRSCRTTCARSLYIKILLDHSYHPVGPLVQDLCIKLLFDHLCKDAVGPLVQDLCIRILWTARIRFQDRVDHFCKIYMHQDPNRYQDPFGPTCIRILSDHLCKISVSGSFWTTCIGCRILCRIVQDHFFGALVSGTCRTTCGRSLYEHLCIKILLASGSCRTTCHLCKISVSGSCWTTCIRILFRLL